MLMNYFRTKPLRGLQLTRKICVFTNENQSINLNIRRESTESTTQLINGELADGYVPSEVERRPLQKWFFQPPLKTPPQRFTMLLPPPNITGTLHLGHAFTAVIQDVMVKWNRMNGIDTMWIPGMDHAGIATQVIVERRIWAESRRTRHDIGRDEFERAVRKWKRDKSHVIGDQLRRLGASLNWDAEFFTMDEQRAAAVVEAFLKLHEDGLIYEADALVNWSCSLQSAISDIEVEHLEISGPTAIALPGRRAPVEFGRLTEFAYQLADDPTLEAVVATTRPETIFGDVALAVHPNDQRHSRVIGKHVVHPLDRGRLLPIIADEFVDANFGTGIVKITPAHDHVDFGVAQRLGLPMRTVFDEGGRMINCGSDFDGLDRFDARRKVLSVLESLGLLRGSREHAMSLPMCGRSKGVVELLMKPQWFIDCRRMAQLALESVESGRIRIEPKHFEKTWTTWLQDIRPWCVSRQLWWGHRIPAYRATDPRGATHTVIARNRAEAFQRAAKLAAAECQIEQVDDVLDTWFSSALLPLSALDWPSESAPARYPLDVMETGHDILFFWVARMAMLCTHLSGRVPFGRVLLHGVVCDAHDKKMSKSVGNVVAPEDVIEGRALADLEAATTKARNLGLLSAEVAQKAVEGQRRMFPDGIHECGVDALRFTLCSYNFKNHFVHFDVQECKTNKFFGNKLWQATKFALKWRPVSMPTTADLKAQFPKTDRSHPRTVGWENEPDIGVMDKWILSRLNFMLAEVNEALSGDNFHVATAALKNFLHYELCDIYLESSKRGLREGNVTHASVLEHCLLIGTRALAPFMPYLAQHLYAHLANGSARLVADARRFPLPENRYRDAALERDVGKLMDVVIAIRRLRKIFNVTAKRQPKVIINSSNEFLVMNGSIIMDLSGCASLAFNSQEVSSSECYISDKVDSAVIRLHVPAELQRSLAVDAEKLEAKRAKLGKELAKLRTTTSSPSYAAKVSPTSHENNLRKIAQLEQKIIRLDFVRSLAENGNCLTQ